MTSCRSCGRSENHGHESEWQPVFAGRELYRGVALQFPASSLRPLLKRPGMAAPIHSLRQGAIGGRTRIGAFAPLGSGS